MNSKNIYEEIDMEVILFDFEDVITTSPGDSETGGDEEEIEEE